MEMVSQLRSQIESILLVVDTPVAAADIAGALAASEADIEEVLAQWSEELTSRGSGIDLRRTEAGWRLYTRAENADAVESFVLDGAQTKLSRAALETLAVVAYRQPVTRAQVSGVRGVNVDGVMRTLTLRGLLAEVEPDDSTGAHRYVTTELFLELLGIESLSQLPELAPLLPDVDAIEDAW
ncbi:MULTISPECIES: SMC-Scp complex subunit ScpB [Corynebacterium]|uniref:Segregation and condensation protein B n=1 Tax=Corynebacterium riegelii TaxID=156976 RepID=A0A0K1RAK8_9CORY|nr:MULTISPECIES: SMC-Scp complex subunit ScpB [Corynebacterium]AKV58433.1 segregation and condensation protein B [Corynebacterium riegelii]OFT75738.1 SMC-Scp complex subunit ScpB [Corynebacterium sp. HMSC30G07]